jgi:homoserine O-acetyltransferase
MTPNFRTALALLLAFFATSSALAQSPAPVPPQQFFDLGDFKLENQSVIRGCQLGYRTVGELDATRSNAILFPTWHTGASEEVLEMLGADAMFDPKGYFVIIVDSIGNGVSCAPSNSTTQHGVDFPAFSIRDMVQSEQRLLSEKFALQHVHAVVGFSMGGAQALQWMVSHPVFMDVVISVSATPRQTSYDLLFWRTEEKAMLEAPEYAGGHYTKNPKLPLFQLIFSMNARSPAFRVKHTDRAAFEKFFADTAGEPEPGTADANNSLWQIRALMGQDIGEPDGPGRSLEKAAKKVKARVLIVQGSQDHLVNPAPGLAFAKLIHATPLLLDNDCGHFAMLCDMAKVHAAVQEALGKVPAN